MKQQFSKKIQKILGTLTVFAFFTIPNICLAVGVSPNPPSTLGTGSGGGGDFNETIVGLYRWGVTLAAVLAVVMLVVGGVQYMGSESLFAKDEGKKRIQAALGGLLLALASALILSTILGPTSGDFQVNLTF